VRREREPHLLTVARPYEQHAVTYLAQSIVRNIDEIENAVIVRGREFVED
jgi:hypothetical protein